MSNKTFTIKGEPYMNVPDVVKQIAKDNNINLEVYYPHMIRIKKGDWNTAAKKRDQDLTWKEQPKYNNKGQKVGTQQIMTGYGKHFPEFMLATNKSNSIEVTFMRKPYEADLLKSFEHLVKGIDPSPFNRRKPMFKPGSGNAFELSTFDAHFGKLAAEIETGYRNYDLKIATGDYNFVCDEIINQALPYEPELCILPVGQDIYHIDNMAGKTTNGVHSMDVDGRITKVNDVVFMVHVRTILELKKMSAVKVIWSPGNHDHFASYMLCFALAQYFRNDPLIEVDVSLPKKGKQIHKAVLWGKTLVGFTHRITNRQSNWANELAQSFPEEWYLSKFREWHHGDQHKKNVVKVHPVTTMGGVVLRQLTALSPVDKWHTENLFTDAVPGGEGFIWNKEKGVIANFMAWTGQYEDYRNELVNSKK